MFCQQCGENLNPDYHYCPKCGNQIISLVDTSKQTSPLWFKIFLSLILLSGALVVFVEFSSEDLTDIISKQLNDIRQDRITEAYYNFTAKSFQEATSLEHFRNFIKNYPFFSQSRSIRFIDRTVNNDQGILEAMLTTSEGTEKQVRYHLIKEGGRWKILSIRLENSSG